MTNFLEIPKGYLFLNTVYSCEAYCTPYYYIIPYKYSL